MQRHPTNPNLILYFESSYQGSPVQESKGPFIRQYLRTLHRTINRAATKYREVFAFRFDGRLPAWFKYMPQSYQNEVIDKFIESFKAKTKHNRQKAFRKNRKSHDTTVRYVWTREVGQRGRPHYHFAILLNKDAFYKMGRYAPGEDNMYNRLHEAWASALGIPLDDVWGLIEIPENACYYIRGDDQASFDKFFFRASYLCKAATKTYGDGSHGFGASRN